MRLVTNLAPMKVFKSMGTLRSFVSFTTLDEALNKLSPGTVEVCWDGDTDAIADRIRQHGLNAVSSINSITPGCRVIIVHDANHCLYVEA